MRALNLVLVLCLVTGGLASVGVVGAQEATPTEAGPSTPTPTPEATETGSNTTNATTGDGPSDSGMLAADVYVEQPRYVSQSVSQSSSGGLNVYTVRGSVQELAPKDFEQSQVIRSGVREDSATLRYDSGINRWILDVQGTEGSYRVFWVVREDGQERTYGTTIKVTQANYEHVQPSTLEELEDQAEFAEIIREKFGEAGIINEDADEEQVVSAIDDAITWYQFYLNPFSALSGQFVTLGIMLIRWPAGWIIFGALFLAYFIRDRKKTRENRRLKRQFANIEDVDEAERQAWERELKRSLSMQTFEDLGLTTTDAQAIREHFDIQNPRQFLHKLRSWMDETGWAGIILDAHDQLGHEIRVERDEDGTISSAELVEGRRTDDGPLAADGGTAAAGHDGADTGIEYVSPGDATDEIILALDWDTLDPGLLWDDRVDADALEMPIANGPDAGREDLVEAFDVPIGEDGQNLHIIERREEFADILLTVIKHIAASQYCDEEGRIRPEMEMIDFLFTFTTVGSEKYRWPLHNTADILMRNLQRLDASERMKDLTERSRDGEL